MLIYLLRLAPSPLPQPFRFFRDWYPALTFPVFYKEVERFAAAFGNWGLTQPIQKLEVRLFRGHPSVYLSERLPWPPLSEYLHFCYFFYLLLFPTIGGYWYFTGRIAAFRELLFLLCLTYTMSYLFYILLPVDSPFYLFEPPGEPIAGHFFYRLVHFVSGRGGARGGAFPSSHVSVATVVWLVVWSTERSLAYIISPAIIGLIFATVYCRLHYALDLIAGLALGGAIFFAHRLFLSKGFYLWG
jgi:membrane-associated phospholipid phosphatase